MPSFLLYIDASLVTNLHWYQNFLNLNWIGFQYIYFISETSSQIVQIGKWFCEDPAFLETQQEQIRGSKI